MQVSEGSAGERHVKKKKKQVSERATERATERVGAGSSRSVAPKTGELPPGYPQDGEKFHCTSENL